MLSANPREVRAALRTILDHLQAQCGPADLGTIEIVLAEALNNIVEHAYRDQSGGRIHVFLQRRPGAVHCRLSDCGRAMPKGGPPRRPGPGMCVTGTHTHALPEGGFGWLLIRTLTRDLHYLRRKGRNRLEFAVPLTEI